MNDDAINRDDQDVSAEQNAPATRIVPIDRRKLSAMSLGKTAKWPRTGRRQQRLNEVLDRRQPDLTVILEHVDDLHNVSSVLRTCDAVGISDVHLVYPPGFEPEGRVSRPISAGTAKWVTMHRHDSITACYDAVRQGGKTILATALTESARDLYAYDLTIPTALVFGNEMRGVSDEAIAGADGQLVIPMLGMAQSLNISVSCAVVLYEALRQRMSIGAYDEPKLGSEERAETLDTWLKK